jgi:endonuclease YncB( thermonuclease family)
VRARTPLVAAGVAVAVLCAGGGWMLRGRLAVWPALAGWPAGRAAPVAELVPAAAAHVAAEPAQVAVLDGDTLRLRDVVVRLLGISAPPRGENCRGPDGSGFDCGAAATNALAELVRAHAVECRLAGHDGMGRPLGVCEASGRQINRALVAAGYARAAAESRPEADPLPAPRAAAGEAPPGLLVVDLRSDEDQARAHRRGLWAAGDAVSW